MHTVEMCWFHCAWRSRDSGWQPSWSQGGSARPTANVKCVIHSTAHPTVSTGALQQVYCGGSVLRYGKTIRKVNAGHAFVEVTTFKRT